MIKKCTILILSLLLCACHSDTDASIPAYYDYELTTKDNTKKLTLRFNQQNVNKYPGWKYSAKRNVGISMWYPSLIEARLPNFWMSTTEETSNTNIKPTPEDRKINLRLGKITSNNTIIDPNLTLNGKMAFDCSIGTTSRNYTEDGRVGNFNRYKHTQEIKSQPTPLVSYLYHPIKKIKGVYCVKYSKSCQIIGITDFGVYYTASDYSKNNIIDEVTEINKGINEYLAGKIVTN